MPPGKKKTTAHRNGVSRRSRNTTAEFERALAKPPTQKYVLRLYVTGMTPKSMRAIENLQSICSEYLRGRCEIEIVDIYQHPQLMEGEQIIAAPTLIKKLPVPLRRLVGDLSDKDRVLFGLDLRANREATSLPLE